MNLDRESEGNEQRSKKENKAETQRDQESDVNHEKAADTIAAWRRSQKEPGGARRSQSLPRKGNKGIRTAGGQQVPAEPWRLNRSCAYSPKDRRPRKCGRWSNFRQKYEPVKFTSIRCCVLQKTKM